MRDSNLDIQIPWIEQVPRDWKTVKLARVTRINTGDMDTIDSTDDGVYPFYVRSPIVRKAGRFTFNTDAVLMSGDGAGAGRIFHRVSGKFACHQRVYCIEFLEQVTKDFGFYYLSIFFPMQVDAGSAKSTVDSIRKPMLNGMPIVFPPVTEQRRITSYIDRKTAEIDGLIEKLRREVELLEQYRRELIARTVTRGLDPDAPMRDSGIEWIGEIPEAWALLRISALYDIRSQKVNDTDYQPLSVTMNGVVAQLEHVAKTNDGDNRKLVRAGDFVINSRSDRRGACGFAPQDGSCSLINIVLSPQQSIHNPYFSYLFRSSLFSDEFYRWGHGIHDDLWTTNWADMKSIQVPVPPLNHQVLIADYLDKKMFEINSTVTGINNQIELLGKYRKQVINDAVTGKIRVGKVA